MDGGVLVGDLLDLETELENIALGFNQLQNIPSMPEDSWPSSTTQQQPPPQLQQHMNGLVAPKSADPFGDSFNPLPSTNGHSVEHHHAPQPPTQNFFPSPMQQQQHVGTPAPWAQFTSPIQPQPQNFFNGMHSGNTPIFSVSGFWILEIFRGEFFGFF